MIEPVTGPGRNKLVDLNHELNRSAQSWTVQLNDSAHDSIQLRAEPVQLMIQIYQFIFAWPCHGFYHRFSLVLQQQ